jgi:hypothetical protein
MRERWQTLPALPGEKRQNELGIHLTLTPDIAATFLTV